MTTDRIAPDVHAPVFDLLPPIFRDCVNPEALRYSLGLPFVRGDWVYATDGRILVRVRSTPEVAALLPLGDRRVPEVEFYFDAAPAYAPEPVTFAVDEPEKCGECDGKGRLPARRCNECGGSGETICSCCGQDRNCPDCDGKGRIHAGPCHDCKGTGYDFDETSYSHAVTFANGTKLGQRYAWLLNQHKAEVFLPVRPKTSVVIDPVRFTALGDVVGFVMPLAPVGSGPKASRRSRS
jgi:hypothetical protein